MARAKKEIDREIAETVKKLPTKEKAQVLDFVRKLSEAKQEGSPKTPARRRKKKVMTWDEFVEHGLYEGDGTHFDHDEIYRQPY